MAESYRVFVHGMKRLKEVLHLPQWPSPFTRLVVENDIFGVDRRGMRSTRRVCRRPAEARPNQSQ
ncbi:MAG: hypothetical protein KY410_06300 [Proteobacteria bacterium]|nr:hypothetical protein [Pseudomonadota bacterium]